ncbi:membrane protein, partial [Sphingomonas sp. LH128]
MKPQQRDRKDRAQTQNPDGLTPAATRRDDAVLLVFPAEQGRSRPAVPDQVRDDEASPRPSLRSRVENWCHRIELAPDLAADIGSRKWLRGLATMLGLSGAALALLPGFSAVEAAATMPLDASQQGEFRSQSIAPLALGADTGRHMGATPLVSPLTGVPERPTVQLTSTLGQGDTLPGLLQRAG